ncbi:MAG: hypothetical protein WCK10_02230, partial [Candidatus Staskawiczbacteria bacterium]
KNAYEVEGMFVISPNLKASALNKDYRRVNGNFSIGNKKILTKNEIKKELGKELSFFEEFL